MWEVPTTLPSIQDLIAATNRNVAGLEEQKRRLAAIVHRHMTAAAHARPYRVQNVLVVGPTGGGKTWLIRNMLTAAGVPHVELNATMYSEVGYAGLDLSSFPVGFYGPPWLLPGEKRNMITPLAQRWGVVVIDEFDKWAVFPNMKERQVGRALQAELLRIAEGDTVYARTRDSEMGTAFDTHRILFIACGAFEGLSRVVAPSEPVDTAYLKAETQHIKTYGFMEELVGRFSSLIILPPLNEQTIYDIIVQHILPCWLQQAQDAGFTLTITEGALRLVANVCVQTRIGARGVEPLLEKALWRAWSAVTPGQEVFLGPEHVVPGAVVREAVACP
jgi:ATP-dependent Clp protease ATP-binding subunit ClpX